MAKDSEHFHLDRYNYTGEILFMVPFRLIWASKFGSKGIEDGNEKFNGILFNFSNEFGFNDSLPFAFSLINKRGKKFFVGRKWRYFSQVIYFDALTVGRARALTLTKCKPNSTKQENSIAKSKSNRFGSTARESYGTKNFEIISNK